MYTIEFYGSEISIDFSTRESQKMCQPKRANPSPIIKLIPIKTPRYFHYISVLSDQNVIFRN